MTYKPPPPQALPQPVPYSDDMFKEHALGRLFLTPGYLWSQQPEMAQLPMSFVAVWSSIELALTQAVTSMAKVDAAIVAALLGKLRSERFPAIKAAMEVGMDRKDVALYKRIAKYLTKIKKRRDRFAHGIWACIEGLDDHALLVDEQDIARVYAALNDDARDTGPGDRGKSAHLRANAPTSIAHPSWEWRVEEHHMMVYSKMDLVRCNHCVHEACDVVNELGHMMGNPPDHWCAPAGESRDRLLSRFPPTARASR